MSYNSNSCLDNNKQHYLKEELYSLVRNDPAIFEFLQAGALDGIWYWDLEKPEHEWISPQFWKILGFDPAEKKHLAAEWQDLIDKGDLQTAATNLDKHCSDPNYPYDQLVRYRHKNGSTVWIRCRGMAIRNQHGKPIRMLGAHTDITQLKLTEEKLMHANKELSDFAHAASHDLKAPLRTISGMLSVLQELIGDDISEEGQQIFEKVNNTAVRMGQLIQGLLEYAELTGTASKKETVDSERLIQDILKDFAEDIKSTNATITTYNCGVVTGNPAILRQLFQNLINNAIKYCHKDVSPCITITGTKQETNWQFAVADNGQGIEPKYHQRIFQLLQRLHHYSDVEGSGLGLSLCKKAVDYHGGHIWLTSEVGKGSTFYFTLSQ
ncbi:PAS domain-containing sensor histidine kinase [Spartinivicinus poritis]|uniref:histidine kinase n=1 Tax=Spartinivicinus poritis TaxID=2994640 RepID=A0ABT5U8P9_9GAMM|nr:PAS domain-containing sensor histidine kinase [Spartinivicinus sp. A2-2]MDE1462757.1 ATP-binding protein [Spartinivicinus sp. A2-2]